MKQSPTALAYSAEVASATKAGRQWHLSRCFVGRNPPTFVGRSRLRTAKAEAHPPCLLRRSSRFGCEGRAPRLRRVPTPHHIITTEALRCFPADWFKPVIRAFTSRPFYGTG